jgi:hypothetical protein
MLNIYNSQVIVNTMNPHLTTGYLKEKLQKASRLRRKYINLKVYHVYLKGRNMMKCGPKPMKLLRNSGEIKTIIDISEGASRRY